MSTHMWTLVSGVERGRSRRKKIDKLRRTFAGVNGGEESLNSEKALRNDRPTSGSFTEPYARFPDEDFTLRSNPPTAAEIKEGVCPVGC